MAPSPENDNTPKAPDKSEKTKTEKQLSPESNKEKAKDAKTLSNLNDGELKALLDEAMTYKNPKDREGKSKLFKALLNEAEENERNARAASAGGSELVRYCNPSAKRNKGNRRKPSSISENMMHGGSLDNLAKEELFGAASHIYQTRRNVSARQREGGSLPCNVNAGVVSYDTFLEEANKKREVKKKEEFLDMEKESLLNHDVLDQNFEAEDMVQATPTNPVAVNFTTKATFPVNGCGEHFWACSRYGTFSSVGKSEQTRSLDSTNSSKSTKTASVDDAISLDLEQRSEKKPFEGENPQPKIIHSHYNIYTNQSSNLYISQTQKHSNIVEDNVKKVDENDNPLHQTTVKAKKKKTQTDKNVRVFDATAVEGHRSDIINKIDLLVDFIEGDSADKSESKEGKSKSVHKSKQLHKQHTEDGSHGGKKQRAHSSKSKECKSDLKKSNSLGEISSVKAEEFNTASGATNDKVVLRTNKNTSAERPRERRSWGSVEPPPIQTLYSNASMENLETADFRVVTKKKKSKKRRSSVSSGRRQNTVGESGSKHAQNRAPSPDLCSSRKYAESVPHSEKSNDSSDVDSVHSLPIDTQHLAAAMPPPLTSSPASDSSASMPISYADIAKNTDKPKDKKSSPDSSYEKVPKEKTPVKTEVIDAKPKSKAKPPPSTATAPVVSGATAAVTAPMVVLMVEKTSPQPTTSAVATQTSGGTVKSDKNTPPDVHNIKNFPAIQPNNKMLNVNVSPQASVVDKASGNNVKSGSNKVQKCASVNTTNSRSKSNVQKPSSSIGQSSVQKDIQTDLSIIQASEKESIQYNAQMLPPDIPDVSTIEKMQFNRQMQQNYQKHRLHHQQYQQHPSSSSSATPVVVNHVIAPIMPHHLASPVVPQHPQQHVQQHPQPQILQQQIPQLQQQSHVSQQQLPQHQQQQQQPIQQQIPRQQQHHQQQQQQQNIYNMVVDCDNSDRTSVVSASNEPEQPAVVILSGADNKEVPGLEFGFDVNEKLLSEDICDDFAARYRPPALFTNSSHNHDKIANYVGAAWDEISSGDVVYYSDDL